MKEVTNKWWFWVLMTLLAIFVITVAFTPTPPVLEEETEVDFSEHIKEEPKIDYFKE